MGYQWQAQASGYGLRPTVGGGGLSGLVERSEGGKVNGLELRGHSNPMLFFLFFFLFLFMCFVLSTTWNKDHVEH